ncbi:MAG TPA: Asp-tRNA(Asn)/Glu-tRNA(Gln) amidotransferase subunit GatB, partial [Bacteroidota bacterium]|nr:Asp-tRNA(Asn)/Glu-tRNA(Gln) amidotransferase subunit GatB [Bacteroidota bacterium]
MNEKYEAVIGLEVHAQLLTKSKAFCSCTTQFGNNPNHNTCPVCLGMPGVLPVLNKRHVEFIMKMGLATNCSITPRSIFARKNYFYPDLPKGYQISQYEDPICQFGHLDVELSDGSVKRIGITRIHMEEDAGKLVHDQHPDSLVDVNRCGTPLIEIVSEPDMRTAHEAYQYLSLIRQLVTYLGICDGNMEEGSLRCDANVSVRLRGETKLGTKTELKNMNSFRNVERAIDYEIARQIDLIEDGGRVIQESLLWDADRNIAVTMRSKEEAHDYRYFPEPDLVPVVVSDAWVSEIREGLPELPQKKRDRFITEFGVPKYDADILTFERPLAEYYESAVEALSAKTPESWKLVSNWVMTDVLRVSNDEHI